MTTIRAFRAGDEQAFLDLHRRSFGQHWSRETWDWRFVKTPLRRTDLFGAFDQDGRCLASYGGVVLDFVLDDDRTLAIQQSDVAVDPDLRRGLGGSRLLVDLTRAFFDHSGQVAEMIWGFPEPGLRRIVVKHARVDILRDVVFLARHVAEPTIAPTAAIECARTSSLDADAVDMLWAECAPELRVATVRDTRYLNWRFLRHPSVDYEVHLAVDATGLRGLMAVRSGGWDANTLTIMEWLVPREDIATEIALVAHALDLAKARGKQWVVAWFPTPEPRFHRFQVTHGFFAQHVPYQQGVRCWRTGCPRHWLNENWFQTMSDIDFF